MYYLLVALAVSVSAPDSGSNLVRMDVNNIRTNEFSDNDIKRIQYNVRKWETELDSNTHVLFDTFETLEQCKSRRAAIRIALRDAGQSSALRSNCYEHIVDDNERRQAKEEN